MNLGMQIAKWAMMPCNVPRKVTGPTSLLRHRSGTRTPSPIQVIWRIEPLCHNDEVLRDKVR